VRPYREIRGHVIYPRSFFRVITKVDGGSTSGAAEFVSGLERLLGRPIARRSPGPRPAAGVRVCVRARKTDIRWEKFESGQERQGLKRLRKNSVPGENLALSG